ncbi:hypothetical protein QF037_000153 [Streptomyces canus]|nr:hypothetical protein [Streptomyces canus]
MTLERTCLDRLAIVYLRGPDEHRRQAPGQAM